MKHLHITVSFEDKRKENFDKGQAELERRRAILREQQMKEEHERLEKEKYEAEKRERKRYFVIFFFNVKKSAIFFRLYILLGSLPYD